MLFFSSSPSGLRGRIRMLSFQGTLVRMPALPEHPGTRQYWIFSLSGSTRDPNPEGYTHLHHGEDQEILKKTQHGRLGLHCQAPIQKGSLNKHTLRGGSSRRSHRERHREGNAPASPGPGGSKEPVGTPCQDTPYHASPRPSSPASSPWPEGQRTRASALRATSWGLLSSAL